MIDVRLGGGARRGREVIDPSHHRLTFLVVTRYHRRDSCSTLVPHPPQPGTIVKMPVTSDLLFVSRAEPGQLSTLDQEQEENAHHELEC